MMNRKVISLVAYNHPDICRDALAHFAKCDGAREWLISVVLDGGYDRKFDAILDAAHDYSFDLQVTRLEKNVGCNAATFISLTQAFASAHTHGWVYHTEDDIVPLATDTLRLATWAGQQFHFDPRVMSMSLWAQTPANIVHSDGYPQSIGMVFPRLKFNALGGFVMWQNTFEQIVRIGWDFDNSQNGWDWNIERIRRKFDWVELAPMLSRVQNIGVTGTHLRADTAMVDPGTSLPITAEQFWYKYVRTEWGAWEVEAAALKSATYWRHS